MTNLTVALPGGRTVAAAPTGPLFNVFVIGLPVPIRNLTPNQPPIAQAQARPDYADYAERGCKRSLLDAWGREYPVEVVSTL